MKRNLDTVSSGSIDRINRLGRRTRLIYGAFSIRACKSLNWQTFLYYFRWMTVKSFGFVCIAAIFISLALTFECVYELRKFEAQVYSGAFIVTGLLREIGPLTISLTWCTCVAALISEEVRERLIEGALDKELSTDYLPTRLLAAMAASVPLSAYGMVTGFITAAMAAPLFGVSSVPSFLNSAREAIEVVDLSVYFVKLILVNPTIAIFSAFFAGIHSFKFNSPASARAVTMTVLAATVANFLITYIAFSHR